MGKRFTSASLVALLMATTFATLTAATTDAAIVDGWHTFTGSSKVWRKIVTVKTPGIIRVVVDHRRTTRRGPCHVKVIVRHIGAGRATFKLPASYGKVKRHYTTTTTRGPARKRARVTLKTNGACAYRVWILRSF